MTSHHTPIGNLFVVAAPSGAGKSTLVSQLIREDPSIHLSISYTTRAPRPGEQQGREYHFVSIDQFKRLGEQGELLESAEIYGNYYGTSKKWIEEQLGAGHDVLLEIDWQGAQQIRRQFSRITGIFILPPSLATLDARLKGRAQDDQAVIELRLNAASSELTHAPEFEYAIINRDLGVALQQLKAIVSATRSRFESQAALHFELFSQLGIRLPHAEAVT